MERNIKGIYIPIEIWMDKNLSWNEKILLMEIDSFTSRDKDCFFSNEYIAELLGVKENTASILMSRLIKKGYVTKTKFDGRFRYVKSNLTFSIVPQSKADFDENHRQGMTEIKGSTYLINKDNKEDKGTLSDSDCAPKGQEIISKSVDEIIAEKREKLRAECEKFIPKYGKPMVDAFVNYWGEANGKRLRWEVKKAESGAFEISRRLATWASKERGFTPQQPQAPIPQRPKKTPWEEMGLTKEQYIELFNK